MSVVDQASSGADRATRWCLAAADQAIGRLVTEIVRMDAIDLAAPWCPDRPTRHARIAALLATMQGPGVAVPDAAAGGRALAAALVATWMRQRETFIRAASLEGQAAVLDVLAEIQRTHVALDAGIAHGDIPAISRAMVRALDDGRVPKPSDASAVG